MIGYNIVARTGSSFEVLFKSIATQAAAEVIVEKLVQLEK